MHKIYFLEFIYSSVYPQNAIPNAISERRTQR